MANAFYLHASNPELVTGLRALKMYAEATNQHADLGVILGRYQKVPVIRGKKSENRRVPDRTSDSQVLWANRGARPYVHTDGRVHDASIVGGKSKKGGTLKLLSAPTGDGKFIVHLETGIPQHWNLDEIAVFMQGTRPENMFSHGSERVDDGSENVMTVRIRWQRPQTRIPGSDDPLKPSKGVRIYSGDAWLMSPGSEVLAHDITGRAFRVVCDQNGPKVTDPGTDKPYDKYLSIVQARLDRRTARTEAVACETKAELPAPEKSGGILSRLVS